MLNISSHVYVTMAYLLWWGICLDILPIFSIVLFVVVVVLLLSLRVFHIFRVTFLYPIFVLQIFSPSLRLFFHSLKSIFCTALFNFIKVQLLIFFFFTFMDHAFYVIAKTHYQTQGHLDFLLCIKVSTVQNIWYSISMRCWLCLVKTVILVCNLQKRLLANTGKDKHIW